MSFSSDIKKELSWHYAPGRHCSIAELAGLINTCGEVAGGAKPYIRIQTESSCVAKKFFTLVKKTFGVNGEIRIRRNNRLKKHRFYQVYLLEPANTCDILQATGLWADGAAVRRADPLVLRSECCKRAYLRGAFLAGGSLSNPEKNYHMEIVMPEERLSQALCEMMNGFGLRAKVIHRKNGYVLYLKEGENIVDALNLMGAHGALLDMENVRILKDMRNNVNRVVNCEMANLNKTINAAVRQVEDIRYIEQTKGLGYLSEQLEEVARLRLAYPEASLKEIGELLSPPVGKSGVNHRLRKIIEIAEDVKGGLS